MARALIPLLALTAMLGCDKAKYADIGNDEGTPETGSPPDTDTIEDTDEPEDSGDPVPVDTDGDGTPDTDDCAPEDPTIHPGAFDVPYDGIDQDCFAGDMRDVDGDGYESTVVGGLDCDDDNGSVNPDSFDGENGEDDDCDGLIDEDVIVEYDTWPVVLGKSGGSIATEAVHVLPSGNIAMQCTFSGEVDIDPDGAELVPRESEDAGADAIYVMFDADRQLAGDFAITSDTSLVISATEVDAGGGYLIAGDFAGVVDFDDATPTFVRRSNGGVDGFFARFNDVGDIAWAYSIGGASDDHIRAVHGAVGGVYIGGSLVNGNLNPAAPPADSINVSATGALDGYVASYDFTTQSNWTAVFAGYGGTSTAEVTHLVEDNGTIWAVGWFSGSIDLDPDATSEAIVTAEGAQDVFIVGLDLTTGAYVASAHFGDAAATLTPSRFIGDGAGTLVLAGMFTGSVDLGRGTVVSSGDDVFVLELTTGMVTSRVLTVGGPGTDSVGGLAFIPGSTDLMLSGGMDDTLTIGTDSLSPVGGTDCWVGRVGTETPWGLRFGSAGDEDCTGLAVDAAGDVWLGGSAVGTVDFGTDGTSDPRPVAGDVDAWLTKLSSAR